MLTVRNILDSAASQIIPEYRILSGTAFIDMAAVDCVSVCEYPAEDFIRKHELILSGLITRENDSTFLAFISDLQNAGASALVVSHADSHYQLSDQIQSYLDKHPLPVIFVPWSCRYGDIVQFVLEQLRNTAINVNAKYENVQKLLLGAYLQNEDLADAARILSDSFSCPVAVFDAAGLCKAHSRCPDFLTDVDAIKKRSAPHDVIDITANDRTYGSVYLFTGMQQAIFDKSQFVRHLLWPLTLWFEKDWIIQVAKQDLRDNFVWKITKGSPDDFDSYCEEGRRLGFYLNGSHTCIVGTIHLLDTSQESARDLWITANINSLKEEVLHVGDRLDQRIMVTFQKDELILYLHNPLNRRDGGADAFLDELEKAVSMSFPRIYFTWGISDPGDDPTNFQKCFQNAKLAHDLCMNTTAQNTRFSFRHSIINNIMSQISSDPAIHAALFNIIKPLLKYDESTGSELVSTLQAYLRCKNLSETARVLHLHRHSLVYRLTKINELAGLSLKNADTFLLLELSVRLFAPKRTEHA